MKVGCGPRRVARGFTLIELVVVLGLICVLVGLLLPAVQSARESARRAACSRHLGQLTLAALTFESINGGLPPSLYGGRPYRPGDTTIGLYSTQCLLLHHIDQVNLFNSINFAAVSSSVEHLGSENTTAASRSIDVFLCPSDPNARSTAFAPNSYRACIGLGELDKSANNHFRLIQNGAFMSAHGVRDGYFVPSVLPLSSIQDGLSNTLAFSEKPIGSTSVTSGVPFRDWYRREIDNDTYKADHWAKACNRPDLGELQVGAGATWMIPGIIYTHFSAAEPPNTPIPDCGSSIGAGLFSARSYHPGGVNASMVDGSVRWFSASTHVGVWRGRGTRSGGE